MRRKQTYFPYYTYSEDGNNRRENITNWALAEFQTQYGTELSKQDIFLLRLCSTAPSTVS